VVQGDRKLEALTQIYLCMAAIVVLACSLPYICNFTMREFDFDLLAVLGNGSILGPKKLTLLKWAAWGVAAFSVGAALIVRPPFTLRLVLTVVSAVVIPLSMTLWLDTTPFGARGNRLQVGWTGMVDYESIFDSNQDYANFDAFYSQWEEKRVSLRGYLMNRWGLDDEDRYKALFFLNLAANLFPFGNAREIQQSGCVIRNEDQDYGAEQNVSAHDFLSAPIGCCVDYANILYYLLKRAGLESRKIELTHAGHVFNEVKLHGQWYALDATLGVFYQSSWRNVVKGSGPVQIIRFPTISSNIKSGENYRPVAGQFRMRFLQWAVSGGEAGVVETGLPSYFSDVKVAARLSDISHN